MMQACVRIFVGAMYACAVFDESLGQTSNNRNVRSTSVESSPARLLVLEGPCAAIAERQLIPWADSSAQVGQR